MDGFRAFKFYTAIKLHFTSKTYDVFKHNGHVKGSQDAYMRRNDYGLFEKLARKFKDDRAFIQYVAANFMYGNPNVIYDETDAISNFNEYTRRRQSITRVFEDDLHKIADMADNINTAFKFSGQKMPLVLNLYAAGMVTIETVSILNDLTNFIDEMLDNPFAMLFEHQLMTIKKSKGFVKYDKDKITKVFETFTEELKSENHGTHVPQQQFHAI